MGKTDFVNTLKEYGVDVVCGEPMSKHTTFKTGGNADFFLSVKTEEELVNIHGHIHICEAERASIKKLIPQQKCNYDRIKKISMLMRIGRFYKGQKLALMKRLAARKKHSMEGLK